MSLRFLRQNTTSASAVIHDADEEDDRQSVLCPVVIGFSGNWHLTIYTNRQTN